MPPQFNHRTDKGSGGTNVRCMTDDQKRLIKWWMSSRDGSLPFMLLNHMTLAEQERFTALYNTLKPFRDIEVDDE